MSGLRGDPTVGKRLPPNHVEAERMVLGAVLRDPAQIEDLLGAIVPDDFYVPAHRRIFEAMQTLALRGDPIDLVSISDDIGMERLEDYGGVRYLADLVDETPAGTHIDYYANLVKEKSMRRRLIHVATTLAEQSYAGENSIEELVGGAERELAQLSDGEFSRPYHGLDTLLTGAVNRIQEFYASQGQVTGLSTGFKHLDKMTTGLHPQQLVIVAGRPGMGKTAFTLNMAVNAARHSPKAVLLFSLEMSNEQLVFRLICSEAEVSMSKLQSGLLTPQDWARVTDAADRLSRLRLYFDDSPLLNVNSMLAKARRLNNELKRRGVCDGVGLVIVDYLQLMAAAKKQDRRDLEIGEMSRGLKLIAKDLQIPVVALSQLNRGLEQRQNKRPVLSDLRESGAIEQDADLILFLYREAMYADDEAIAAGQVDDRQVELIVGKQRNGPTGKMNLHFFSEFMLFADPALPHQEAAADEYL